MSDRPGKWLLAIASILATLGLAETVSRFIWSSPQQVIVAPAPDFSARMDLEKRPLRVEVATRPEEAYNHFYRLTVAGRRMRANTLALVSNHVISGRSVEIHTNSLGYRNPEIGENRGRRLLFLGDSITLAAYLDESETFVRQIQQLAGRDGKAWETVNAGVAGISLKTELSILTETGLSVSPDVVVLNFYLNDFQESLGVTISRIPAPVRYSRLLYRLLRAWYLESLDVTELIHAAPETEIRRDHGIITGTPSDYLRIYSLESERIDAWRTTYRESAPAAPFYRRVDDNFHDWGGAFAPEAWDYMRPLFDELKRLSEENGFELRIVCHPVFDQVENSTLYDEPQRRLLSICSDLDIAFLDLLTALRQEHRAGRGPLFYDDCHHTPEGSQIVAEEIYSFLRQGK